MRRRKIRSRDTEVQLNITTFMNLMVVLVPFLLITAAFSEMSVLQLTLPPTSAIPQQQQDEQKKPIVLEVLIYKNRLEVVDRQTGPLKIIPVTRTGHDYKTLTTLLKAIKLRFPEITDVTLLLERDTAYDVLVQTMDHVRMTYQLQSGTSVEVELFPDIAIGDAPPDAQAAPQAAPATTGGNA